MKTKATLIASLFTAAFILSPSAMANQSPVESLVKNMVKDALVEVGNDIETNIKRSVLATSYQLLEDENGEQVIGKVTITDIDTSASNIVFENENSEKS